MVKGQLPVRCECGRVEALADALSPRTVTRVVCYCADCQAYARFLGRQTMLDPAGGTDIVQLAAGHLRIVAGHDCLAGARLTDRPTVRWHTTCCRSAIANMAAMAAPALGIPAAAFAVERDQLERLIGPPIGAIHGEAATQPVPRSSHGIGMRIMLRAVPKVMLWKLAGHAGRNPFAGLAAERHHLPG